MPLPSARQLPALKGRSILTKHLHSVYSHPASPSSYSYDTDSTTACDVASRAAASGTQWPGARTSAASLPGEPDCMLDINERPPQSQPFPTQKHFNSLGTSSALAPSPQIQTRPDYQCSVSAGSTMVLARSAPLTPSQCSLRPRFKRDRLELDDAIEVASLLLSVGEDKAEGGVVAIDDARLRADDTPDRGGTITSVVPSPSSPSITGICPSSPTILFTACPSFAAAARAFTAAAALVTALAAAASPTPTRRSHHSSPAHR
ncbi:hypothetical protein B0H14DRAFT_3478860 [Mycena olivaceomarginata]|nr:hypothetical protein B0H14DRAFT_3478860 [Mycena olivaceomarginata]